MLNRCGIFVYAVDVGLLAFRRETHAGDRRLATTHRCEKFVFSLFSARRESREAIEYLREVPPARFLLLAIRIVRERGS